MVLAQNARKNSGEMCLAEASVLVGRGVPDRVLNKRLRSPYEPGPYLVRVVLTERREEVEKGACKPKQIIF